MKHHRGVPLVFFLFSVLACLPLSAQAVKPGVLNSDDIKRLVPSTYFFRGQSATVQIRNSGGFSCADGKLVLAGLVVARTFTSATCR